MTGNRKGQSLDGMKGREGAWEEGASKIKAPGGGRKKGVG